MTQSEDEHAAEVERAYGSGHRLFVAPNRSGGWRCYVGRENASACERIVAATFRTAETREAATEATLAVLREKVERRARDSESAWNAVRDAAVARDAQGLRLALKQLADVWGGAMSGDTIIAGPRAVTAAEAEARCRAIVAALWTHHAIDTGTTEDGCASVCVMATVPPLRGMTLIAMTKRSSFGRAWRAVLCHVEQRAQREYDRMLCDAADLEARAAHERAEAEKIRAILDGAQKGGA